ncbi:hypothetical protein [Treponema sp. R6D11]
MNNNNNILGQVFELIDNLEDVIENGRNVPLSGRALIDKETAMEVIREIRVKIPTEMTQAKYIWTQRNQLIEEAKKEAEIIVKQAESNMISMIDDHEIMRKAYKRATEKEENTRRKAREITLQTNETIEKKFYESEKILEQTLEFMRKNRMAMNGQAANQAMKEQAMQRAKKILDEEDE